jgi:hypothetical protein
MNRVALSSNLREKSQWDHRNRVDHEQKHVFSHKYNPNRYRFEFSKDSTRIVVKHIARSKSRDEIGLYVLNEKLKQVWGGSNVKMPYSLSEIKILDLAVDLEDNAYVFIEREGKEILLQFSDGKLEKELSLRTKLRHIHTSQVLNSGKNDFIFTGYYKTQKESSIAGGVYFFKVDSEWNISNMKMHPTPANFADEKDPELTFNNLEVKNSYIQEDGSVILIGEVYRSSYSAATSSASMFGNILIAKFDTEGNIKWMKKIAKQQLLYTGFKYRKIQDKHYIFFVDDIANQTLKPGKTPSVFAFEKGRYLTACTINDEDGASERKIMTKEGSRYCPATPQLHFLSDNEYIFLSSQRSGAVPSITNSLKAGAIVKGTLPY